MSSAVSELDGSKDHHHLYIFQFITEIYQLWRQGIRNITRTVVPCAFHNLLQAIHSETENPGSSNKNIVWTSAPLFCSFITQELTYSNCKQENTVKGYVWQLPLLFKMSSSHFQQLSSILRQKLNYSSLWGGKTISGTTFHVWFAEKAWDVLLVFSTCLPHVAFLCTQILVAPAGRFTDLFIHQVLKFFPDSTLTYFPSGKRKVF